MTQPITWRAVGAGALLILAVATPPLVLARLARGEGPVRSNLWVMASLGLLVGFAVGGRKAALLRPDMPAVHSAAAAIIAFAAFASYAVGRRLVTGEGVSLAVTITLLVLLQVTVSAASVTGYLAARRRRRTSPQVRR